MNLRIATYLAFEGLVSELTPLLDDIADAIVKRGFANVEDADSLVSLVVVGESGLSEYASADEFARMVVKDAHTVLIPIKEETNVSGDKRQASSKD